MPITAAAIFLIDFAILLGVTDLSGNPPVCEPRISAASPSAKTPWVEIRNPCNSVVELDETVLRWEGNNYGWGAAQLSGELAPGECMLVQKFDQPLLDGLTCGAGLALFSIFDDALSDTPSDEVRYGTGRPCGPTDTRDVMAPGPQQRIELVDGTWIVIDDNRSTCAPKHPHPHPGPGDKVKTCAPSPDMCDIVAQSCKQDGMPHDVCEGMRLNVCPGARAMSCKALETICLETGKPCKHIINTCMKELDGCGPSSCVEAGQLTEAQALSTCYAYPSLLGVCEGEEPDASHCMSLLTWDQCGITTCEWIECQQDIAAIGSICPTEMPESCAAVLACDAAEQVGSEPNCCEEHGAVPGKRDTCSVSEGNFCIGCEYEPVLCMTHGCTTEGEKDCCLSPEGETVPC